MEQLLTLLQINDSMFPIGSFTHSYGLETYVSNRMVKDNDSAANYAVNMLKYSVFYNDAAFLNEAWNICDTRRVWKKIEQLDNLATALKAPMEIRQASNKLAIRFLKLTLELKSFDFSKKYLSAIQEGKVNGHYAIAFGMYTQLSGIRREDALRAFYYNMLNGIVTNCAKIIPISQTVSQKILFQLKETIEDLVKKQNDLESDKIGLCCIGQEIRCMQHEKLYTRIYIS